MDAEEGGGGSPTSLNAAPSASVPSLQGGLRPAAPWSWARAGVRPHLPLLLLLEKQQKESAPLMSPLQEGVGSRRSTTHTQRRRKKQTLISGSRRGMLSDRVSTCGGTEAGVGKGENGWLH